MTRNTIVAIATAAVLAVGLVGCTLAGSPTSASSPLASEQPVDPSPVITPSGTPTPVPVPTDEPAPVDSAEPTAAPPADWNDDELAGACKEAWIESGSVTDWSMYSPDVKVVQQDAAYYVAISSTSGADLRDCTISGTPDAPDVTLGKA